MASASTNKIRKMYEGLSIPERIRLFAKLYREQNNEEIDRLRSSTPVEHYEAYNRALAIMNTLNDSAVDWLSVYKTAMQRDYLRTLIVARSAAQESLTRISIRNAWGMFRFPVTKSEYHALQLMEWEEPYSLERYAEHLLEFAETFSDEIAALLEGLDLTESEDYAIAEERVQKAIADAISSGALPKPTKHEGEMSLPYGVFAAWGEGLKSEKAMKPWPGLHLPALEYLGADLGPKEWDIRPDKEAEQVHERRSEMIAAFALLQKALNRDIALETIQGFMLHIPTTWEEHEEITEMAKKALGQEPTDSYADDVLTAAKVHAIHRAELEGLAQAIETIQKEDFYGEDPLWPETRMLLESTHTEAERFQEAWEAVNSVMGFSLKEALGIDPFQRPEVIDPEDPYASVPAPMPIEEPNPELMLTLIRRAAGTNPAPTR